MSAEHISMIDLELTQIEEYLHAKRHDDYFVEDVLKNIQY